MRKAVAVQPRKPRTAVRGLARAAAVAAQHPRSQCPRRGAPGFVAPVHDELTTRARGHGDAHGLGAGPFADAVVDRLTDAVGAGTGIGVALVCRARGVSVSKLPAVHAD